MEKEHLNITLEEGEEIICEDRTDKETCINGSFGNAGIILLYFVMLGFTASSSTVFLAMLFLYPVLAFFMMLYHRKSFDTNYIFTNKAVYIKRQGDSFYKKYILYSALTRIELKERNIRFVSKNKELELCYLEKAAETFKEIMLAFEKIKAGKTKVTKSPENNSPVFSTVTGYSPSESEMSENSPGTNGLTDSKNVESVTFTEEEW